MALSDEQVAACRAWCAGHYWQLQTRGRARYAYKEESFVRYYEEANLDPSLLEPLMEYLRTDACLEAGAFTVHNKPWDTTGWKPLRAWYETQEGQRKEATKLKLVRIYHALVKVDTQDGDGPYEVEKGCQYKVTNTFVWNADALPEVPASTSGVMWSMKGITRDQESGLWSACIEKRERVQQDVGGYRTGGTVFETTHEEQHLGVKAADVAGTGKAAAAGNGRIVRRKVTKNADCTSDVQNEEVRELANKGSMTETTRTLRGTRTVTVNRNMSEKASEKALKIGQRVRNERTEGGRWNQTIEKAGSTGAGRVTRSCRKTVFQEDDQSVTNQTDDPGTEHVDPAAGGVVRSVRVEATENGTFDVTESKTVEKNVPNAVVVVSRSLDGMTKESTERGAAAAGDTVGLQVGESVRNEQTDGGRWNVTRRTVVNQDVGITSEDCTQGATEHQHTETSGTAADPGSVEHVAADGEIVTIEKQKTEKGSWIKRTRTRKAKGLSKTYSYADAGKNVVVQVERNAASAPQATSSAKNVEVDEQISVNEFGLLDAVVRKRTVKTATSNVTFGTVSEHVNVARTENGTSDGPNEVGEQNVEVQVESNPNGLGGYNIVKRKTTFKPASSSSEARNPMYVEKETHTTNDVNTALVENAQRGEVVNVSSQVNAHGSATTRVVRRTALEAHEVMDWTDTEVTPSGSSMYSNLIEVYRNLRKVPDLAPGFDTASPSVSINEFGLLDVTIKYRKLLWWDRDGRGSSGEQFDDKKTVTVAVDKVAKGSKIYWMEYNVVRRILRSSLANMVSEIGKNPGFPELGLVSGISGGYATIYMSKDGGTSKSRSINGGNNG